MSYDIDTVKGIILKFSYDLELFKGSSWGVHMHDATSRMPSCLVYFAGIEVEGEWAI